MDLTYGMHSLDLTMRKTSMKTVLEAVKGTMQAFRLYCKVLEHTF